jgi:hypothetical protein
MKKRVATTAPGAHQRKGEFRKVGENLYRYFIERPVLCGLQNQGQADLEIAQNQLKPATGNSRNGSSRKNWKSRAESNRTRPTSPFPNS